MLSCWLFFRYIDKMNMTESRSLLASVHVSYLSDLSHAYSRLQIVF